MTYLSQVRALLDADPGMAQELDEIVEAVGCTRRTAEEYVRMWRNAPGPFALERVTEGAWLPSCESCVAFQACKMLLQVTEAFKVSIPSLCEAVTEEEKGRYQAQGVWDVVVASRKLVREQEEGMMVQQKTMREVGLETLCARLLSMLEHDVQDEDPDVVWQAIEEGWEQIGGRSAWVKERAE